MLFSAELNDFKIIHNVFKSIAIRDVSLMKVLY